MPATALAPAPAPPALPAAGSARLLMPTWAEPLARPARYKSVRGGRGGGKSHALATIALLRLLGQLPGYPPGPVLMAFGREHKNATDRSVAAVFEAKVEAAGLRPLFDFRRESVRCVNGSEAVYCGLNRDTVEALRSMEGLAGVWVEEAHRLSAEVAEALIPSVRADGSELWFSWNPRYVTDWVWRRFVDSPRDGDVSIEANWQDNPWFPAVLDAERLALEEDDPARAAHVYGGDPRQDAADLVLSPAQLRACVAADPLTPEARFVEAGFDLAFGGGDKCALIVRRGADVLDADLWPGGDFEASCARVHRRMMAACDQGRAARLWFDATGAHPVAETLARIAGGRTEYLVRAVSFGEAPVGADKPFERGVTNGAMFSRRNAQLAWAVRLRVLRPAEAEPPWRLRLPPDLPHLDELLRQCARPTWEDHKVTGKIVVDKRKPSPDLFDALTLAFTADSRGGLQARRPKLPYSSVGAWNADSVRY